MGWIGHCCDSLGLADLSPGPSGPRLSLASLCTRTRPSLARRRIGIYPRIGTTRLRDFAAIDANKFFKELGQVLSKRTLVMI